MFRSLAAAVSAALLLPAAHASWVLGHPREGLVADRLDPLVNPGALASHVHAVVGSNKFAATADYKSLQDASCTTAAPQADKSIYWAPHLYHVNANGTYTRIPILFVNTYYLHRTGPNTPLSSIQPFPEGLRMLAGEQYRTAYNSSDSASKAVSYVCLDYQNGSSGDLQQFPDHNCKNGLRTQLHFPSCWTGGDKDSPDHKAHMSYPINSAEGGDCPTTHPHKLMNLFFEFTYDVGAFDFRPGQTNWVFANGDTTGLSMHGDFINGWDVNTLANAVKQCTDMFFDSDLEKCAPLAASIDRKKSQSCTIPRAVEEEIDGPLKVLPGCNPVNGGPVAKASTCPNLVVPAIKGVSPAHTLAAGATTSAIATASSSAPAQQQSTHSVSSSSAGVSSASTSKASSSAAGVPTSAPLSSASSGPTSAPVSSSRPANPPPASSSNAAPASSSRAANPPPPASSSRAAPPPPSATPSPASSSSSAPAHGSHHTFSFPHGHHFGQHGSSTHVNVALPTQSPDVKQCKRSDDAPSQKRAEEEFETRRSAFSKHRRHAKRLSNQH